MAPPVGLDNPNVKVSFFSWSTSLWMVTLNCNRTTPGANVKVWDDVYGAVGVTSDVDASTSPMSGLEE